MVKMSLLYTPNTSVQECVDIIKAADELGFYACYLGDATYLLDLWVCLAAAAGQTKRIRLGPNATHVILREPTLIAQALATLDELTGGRVDAVISFGGPTLLSKYRINWQGARPVARVKEAVQVIRTLLDEGEIEFEGEFFKYTDLFTSARPVQKHLPLKVAAMGGWRSPEVAGEVADGMHIVLAHSRRACEYAIEHVKIGAARAGRDWKELDLGAALLWVCSEDSKAAKEVARIQVALYMPSIHQKLAELYGISYESLQPIKDAVGRGDIGKAIDLTTLDLVDKLSIAGTPEECAEKIKTNIIPAGMNHVIPMIIDPSYSISPSSAKHISGKAVEGVPDVRGQLRLIHDRVMPALN